MSDSRDKPKHQPSPKHTLEEVLRSLQDMVRNELTEGPPPAVKAKPAKKSAPEKTPEKPKKPAPPAKPAEVSAGIQEELVLTPTPAPPTKPAPRAAAAAPTSAPPAAKLNWDDIPVLQDVVVAPPLPASMTPERAQAMATRMLAKLNQELRQAGQPPLDPVIIPRLAELLREVLEAEIGPPAKPR